MRMKLFATSILAILLLAGISSVPAADDDAANLQSMLDEFLANTATVAAHERFWADDLIYTSSSGTRTNKTEIIEGMREAEAQASDSDAEPSIAYRAEDVRIQVYGSTAIVAFRLLAELPGATAGTNQYLNTGTFLKRGDQWQAVAWQATRIPPDPEPGTGD